MATNLPDESFRDSISTIDEKGKECSFTRKNLRDRFTISEK